MIRIRPGFIAASWLLHGLIAPLLLASAATASCEGLWDLSGQWTINQDNGYSITVTIFQKGTELFGSADFRNPGINTHYFTHIDEGHFEGTAISLRIVWDVEFVGIYTGTIDDLGHISGTTSREGYPGSSAGWSGNRAANCIVAAAPPPPPPPPSQAESPLQKSGVLKSPGTDIFKKTATPPRGGTEYATANAPATVYEKPGGPAFTDANGNDIGIPQNSKWLVLATQGDPAKGDPVWYELQTNKPSPPTPALTPVPGWVWWKDVTIGP